MLDNFHEAENDEMRFDVFTHHLSLYESIEDELKTWLGENWERWEEKKEDWFNAAAISTVSEDFLPKKALRIWAGWRVGRQVLSR